MVKRIKGVQSDPDHPDDKEGYDDPQKRSEPAFNNVCISSLVFAFVGIGVLLSLATWSYITTMASVDDTHKPDRTKLHSHKHNVSYHKQNGITDFISKMETDNLDDGVDGMTMNKPAFVSSSKIAPANNSVKAYRLVSNASKPRIVPAVADGLNLDVMDGASLGKRIESFSPSEVHTMQERLSHRRWKPHPHNVRKISRKDENKTNSK